MPDDTTTLPPDLANAVAALYARLDADIHASAVPCFARGVCCNFPKAGHELFASEIERRFALTTWADPANRLPGFTANPDPELCPFWIEGKCSHRVGRPVGCRVYFCETGTMTQKEHQVRMGDWTESALAELRALAEQHGVPWDYQRFIAGLREQMAAVESA
jgi:hypothetical protein